MNSFKLILIALALVFSSCKKEKFSVPKPSHLIGHASALKNGVIWEVDLSAKHSLRDSNNIAISLAKYDTIPWFLREVLHFSNIPFQLGRVVQLKPPPTIPKPLFPSSSFGYWEIDVAYSWLKPDSTDLNNFIEITSIDTATGKVEGIFNMTYRTNMPHPRYPDTLLHFTDGRFSTYVK
jgi:hypothetical protein